jgi:hypothetical protein
MVLLYNDCILGLKLPSRVVFVDLFIPAVGVVSPCMDLLIPAVGVVSPCIYGHRICERD